MDKKKIAIILNISSGNQEADSVRKQIEEISRELNMNKEIFLVHPGSDIHEIVKKILTDGYSVVVAAGGDGTVSSVAGELIGTPTTLGIIPIGTHNHFAKDIQIPLDIKDALTVVVEGEIISIDTASVNGHFFVNNSNIGLYPKIVRRREEFQNKGFSKLSAFILAFFIIMEKNSFVRLQIITPEKKIIQKTSFFFVGNNKYSMEGYDLISRESLVKGELFISLMKRISRWKLFVITVEVILGLLYQSDYFNVWTSKKITVHSDRKLLQVALDGETIALEPPLNYLTHPRSLRVIVTKKYAHDNPHF